VTPPHDRSIRSDNLGFFFAQMNEVVIVCCSVVQCGTACCSVLQYVAVVAYSTHIGRPCMTGQVQGGGES